MIRHVPADLSNPDDPAVVEAQTRRCDQCKAPVGELCVKRQGFRDDLKGRLVHIGRRLKP